MSESFDLGDVLSITTGKLVSRDHMGGVYRILNFMTDDNLFTHQLPRAIRECQGPLLAQHPDLADIEVPTGLDQPGAIDRWLDSLAPVYGTSRDVEPLAVDEHTHIDPVSELGLMGVGPDRVIVVGGETR